MQNKLGKCSIPLLFLVIWIVMNDGFSLFNLITGVVVVGFSICLSSYLLGFSYVKVFYLPVLKFVKYIAFLLVKIYASGISATYSIITGKINPGFVKCSIDKRIKNVSIHNIIASSITLTPGTITVDNINGKLTVLSLHCEEENPAAVFEPHLLELEYALKKDE